MVKSLGSLGYLIIISLNALQVILFILPGEVFEIISGLMYGPYLGLLVVELGIMLGSFIILSIIKLFPPKSGKFKSYLQKKKLFSVLENAKQTEIIIFFITLIPCLPKDILLFIVPYSKIKTPKFLLINALARIPSIISSTYFGSSLLKGNYKLAFIILGLQALVGVIGLIFNKQILKLLTRKSIKK